MTGSGSHCSWPTKPSGSSHNPSPPIARPTAWSYGLLGALHFVTLWWLREPRAEAEQVADQVTQLLWSGMRAGTDPDPAAQ